MIHSKLYPNTLIIGLSLYIQALTRTKFGCTKKTKKRPLYYTIIPSFCGPFF